MLGINKICILGFCALLPLWSRAQDSFEKFKKKAEGEFSSFRDSRNREFEEFRAKANEEYAALIKKAWEELNALKGIPKPDDKPVPPTVYPDNDKDEPIKDNPMPFDEVIPMPKPKPQPEPVVPIDDSPKPPVETYYTFRYFGTDLRVRLSDNHRFSMQGCGENELSAAWNRLAGSDYNNVINDCLQLRRDYRLCDWAYLIMLRDLSVSFFGKRCNESVLFLAYIYCQSGYKMRLARSDNELVMLFASDYTIFDTTYFDVDGVKYYPFDCNVKQLYVCQAEFPEERLLSLQVSEEPQLAVRMSANRRLQSQRYKNVAATVSTNENLLEFFSTYPTSMIRNDQGTRWAMYANTPLSPQAKSSLYPALRKEISGLSQLEAVSRLLNFVQTAFVYEYDDKVWGGDRAFFADETLYYPYCDCEDRSILLSRIVRDLLGLDVVLIFYPGHLAAAVEFTDSVTGDYVSVNGRRYVICDPTYIGAPVGATMPQMDNATAKVILLD